MASAAAVSADISRSPIQDPDVAEGFAGGVKSVSPPPVDEDDDIGPTRRRPAAISSMFPDGDSRLVEDPAEKDDQDEPLDDADIDEAALFGDDDDVADAAPAKVRTLDDEELDSGDDEGRRDRAAQYDDQNTVQVPSVPTSTTTDAFTSGNPQAASAAQVHGEPGGEKNVIETKMEQAFDKEGKDTEIFSGSGVGRTDNFGGKFA